MTIKQYAELGGITLIAIVVVEFDMWIGHLSNTIPMACIVAMVSWTAYWVGTLKERWKRDKQMAVLVAERLLGKKDTPVSPDPSWTNGQAQSLGLGGTGQSTNLLSQAKKNAMIARLQQNSALSKALGNAGTGSSQGIIGNATGKIL